MAAFPSILVAMSLLIIEEVLGAKRQTRNTLKNSKFKEWIAQIANLNKEQRDEVAFRLGGTQEPCPKSVRDMPPALAEATAVVCPHCGHDKLGKWGQASGLCRWRCKECGRTFNALTRTPLARLRKKEKWLDNAQAMIEGKSIRETARQCGVHRNTSFRWRHRFLAWQQQAQCMDLSGIAESDATYFYRSEKGSKKLQRLPRKRGGDGIGPGLSEDLVPVLTLRDRSGKGAERVAPEQLGKHARELYQRHLKSDTLLLTDGSTELCAAARSRNQEAHRALPGLESRGGQGSPYHLQTTNGFHAHLKQWMARFHGVATKYLSNYVGWHRHLMERSHQNDRNAFIQLSFNPLSIDPQLMMT
jgi:transposase-like protein